MSDNAVPKRQTSGQSGPHSAEISSDMRGGTSSQSEPIASGNYVATLSEPYATFERMRRIRAYYFERDFVRQARYMENFTDFCEVEKPLDTHRIYSKMDDAQLRTYFTWRTMVRNGSVTDTSLPYVYCHIYELLNNIGCGSPSDGMEQLISIWNGFRKFNKNIDRYMGDWIRDYYVINHKSFIVPFSEYRSRFPEVEGTSDDGSGKVFSLDELKLIERSSSFRITDGRFYKTSDRAVIEGCACHVMKELSKHFESNGVDIRSLFVTMQDVPYTPFSMAVYYADNFAYMKPYSVRISDHETMRCKSPFRWEIEEASFGEYRSVVGFILKVIEIKMREYFGFKGKLKMPGMSTVKGNLLFGNGYGSSFEQIAPDSMENRTLGILRSKKFIRCVENAISDFASKNRICATDGNITVSRPVSIDMSRLDRIRDEHMQTAARLNTEEDDMQEDDADGPEEAGPMIEDVLAAQSGGISGLVSSLTEEECRFLVSVMDGVSAIRGSELIVESINEKALRAINDNIIDGADGRCSVYEEYNSELLDLLSESNDE